METIDELGPQHHPSEPDGMGLYRLARTGAGIYVLLDPSGSARGCPQNWARGLVWPARLRAARGRHGISQQELATRIGVSITQISRWERGEFTPSRMAEPLIEAALAALDKEAGG